MNNKVITLLLLSCFSIFTMNGMNAFYGTEFEFCIPGETPPKQRAAKIGQLIETYTNPEKSSRGDFEQFKSSFEICLKNNPSLKSDLSIPSVMRGYSLQDWVSSEIGNCSHPHYHHNIHDGDRALRLKEIEAILVAATPSINKEKAATASTKATWALNDYVIWGMLTSAISYWLIERRDILGIKNSKKN